jgi:hypothetical protein
LNPYAQFVITYIDEDNDVVTMADENDLLDVLNQGLNPLRLEVSLTSQNNRATEKQPQSQPSTPRNFSIPKEQGSGNAHPTLGDRFVPSFPVGEVHGFGLNGNHGFGVCAIMVC